MKTRDLRVTGYRPLVPPAIILEELALSETGSRLVATWRDELTRILSQQDDRPPHAIQAHSMGPASKSSGPCSLP